MLAYYCFEAARLNIVPFFEWSVKARASVIFFFIAFVALDFAPWMLLLFGTVDLAGALWTAWALRQQKMVIA
jgi:hypothetical protein